MEFKPFSKKQLQVLTWWCAGSKYMNRDAIICDGAVRSGKTLCMSLSFVAWAFYRFELGDFALCGKTIRSLRRNMVTPLIPVLTQLGFSCTEKLSQNVLLIEKDGRQNRFYLFGGKDEASGALIQGMTLSGVLFDEVALMPKSFVEQALARCSVTYSTFWFNCNPEYPGHWFRREWILDCKQKNAFYLHFTMEDNPSLSSKMIARYKTLYSGTFYQRFIEGKWVSAQGVVYPFMSDEEMFVPVPQEPFDRYAVSCDYGTVNPASFGLWGLKKQIWYRIDEYYYHSKQEGMQRTDEEHYQGLVALIGGRNVTEITVDPSAASFIEVIRRHGKYRVVPAKNQVVDGIRQVSTVLKEKKVRICNTCADAMREFGLYRWDTGSKDVPVKENDHAMDDIRYFVTTIYNENNESFFAVALKR